MPCVGSVRNQNHIRLTCDHRPQSFAKDRVIVADSMMQPVFGERR
jgi:hypothetical protein